MRRQWLRIVLFAIGGCLVIPAAIVIALVVLAGSLDEAESPSSITTRDTRTAQQRIDDSRVPMNEAKRVEVCSRYADWNAAQASSTTAPGVNERDTLPYSYEAAQEVNMANRMKQEAWTECGIRLILDVPTIDYGFDD